MSEKTSYVWEQVRLFDEGVTFPSDVRELAFGLNEGDYIWEWDGDDLPRDVQEQLDHICDLIGAWLAKIDRGLESDGKGIVVVDAAARER